MSLIVSATAKKLSMANIDRSAAAQALAKVIAYKNVGKEKEAAEWLKKLLDILK